MSFRWLHITAEGQTEEDFVKDILAPYLIKFNVISDVRRVLTSRDKGKRYRGGLINYEKAKKDIQTWLKEDSSNESRFTTMFDLYGLPGNFPGWADAQKLQDPYAKVGALEKAMREDIGDWRFIPYIQLHEFEALVLANPQNLAYEYFDRKKEIARLEKVLLDSKNNPELINDGPETAPSKRILHLIPEYDKVSAGPTIAGLEGIDGLMGKCLHFKEWVTKIVEHTRKPNHP